MSKQIIACALLCLPVFAFAADEVDETTMTVAGVRAVEDHWTQAFLSGDSAYLDALLDPQYVSVGQTGRARPRAEIIELSKKIAATPRKDPVPHSDVAIVVHGNAAIAMASSDTDTSLDVFYYEGGRWHAWYSQHTPRKAAN
jgi:Domain of unknown function (DUF4440)